jgi:hypothetical protein
VVERACHLTVDRPTTTSRTSHRGCRRRNRRMRRHSCESTTWDLSSVCHDGGPRAGLGWSAEDPISGAEVTRGLDAGAGRPHR